MRRYSRLALCAAAALLLGCAHGVLNSELTSPVGAQKGYRLPPATEENTDSLFVILAFSGGGTRAAALSYGLLEQLARTNIYWDGEMRTLLSEVDVISSVSGGSFTAAYYSLFPETFFSEYETVFLKRRIQSQLIRRLFSPRNWFRLPRRTFDRIHLAAELYDQQVFKGARYEDLIREPSRPYVIVNATDITLGSRFEFTQDQFDPMCADLAELKVANAVAASSAFPGLLSPLTLESFRAGNACGYQPPDWFQNAQDREANRRRYAEAQRLAAYLDAASKQYVHLIDGGPSDNIGLRGPIEALISNDSPWSLLDKMNQGEVEKVVVITANAKTAAIPGWDTRRNAPRLLKTLGAATSTPMARYSFESVELAGSVARADQKAQQNLEDCRAVFAEDCPDAEFPAPPLQAVDFYTVEIAFDAIENAERQRFFRNLPTSFQLPPPVVDCVRGLAGTLLTEAKSFDKLLTDLEDLARADDVEPPARAPAPGYPWPCR